MKSIRLKNFDYSSNGAYFITICSNGKKCIFGEIIVRDKADYENIWDYIEYNAAKWNEDKYFV